MFYGSEHVLCGDVTSGATLMGLFRRLRSPFKCVLNISCGGGAVPYEKGYKYSLKVLLYLTLVNHCWSVFYLLV